MTADAGLARELSALRDELSATRREPPSPGLDQDAGREKATKARATDTAGEESEASEQLGDLLKVLKEFVEEAEHRMSEYPTASIIGAFLLGIFVGRLLGKR